MTEPIFFRHTRTLTIEEIVTITGAAPGGAAPSGKSISNVAPVDRAGPHDLTFIDKVKFEDALKVTQAGACLTQKKYANLVPAHVVCLTVDNPYRAFVAVACALFPQALRPSSLIEASGISRAAQVHPAARIEAGVTIDPSAIVGPRAEIGAGTLIGANAVVGPDVRIGRDCSIGAGVTITHTLIGDRVIVHPGCRIGQDGFGFLVGAKGHGKIPQLGRVIIQDNVEIGANCTIDRGGIRDTVIGEGTKIDNLVQIGHNTMIGRHCLFAGQAGIAGSATIGDRVILAGQAGVIDNVTIGDDAFIGVGSVAMTDVPPNERWGGSPARPMREWIRTEFVKRRSAADGAASHDKD